MAKHSATTHVFERIVKSPNDKREYRTIKLSNGIRALLVSDLQSLDSSANSVQHNKRAQSECMSDDGEEINDNSDNDNSENDNSENDMSDCSDDERPCKKRKSEDSGQKLSAAALCIGVGSFSDPKEIPGLAHFLEHMVFMGSEKYPDENGFDSFIKKHGGGDNAFTDCERTVFYFDVTPTHFHKALDMFAQFFIHPLMKQDSVDREIKSVDSEYDMALPSDNYRKEQLLGSMAKDGHPMGKFMWGNIKSLKEDPHCKGLEIYDYLRKFYHDYYLPHSMTVVVQSKESLNDLQTLVEETFSLMPSSSKQPPSFSKYQDPFDCPKFYKLYKGIPIKKVHELIVQWSLPSMLCQYRSKPLHYLSWLVGHEGKGSILSYLRKRLWATDLDGGNSESGFEHNSCHALFSVNVTLTELGVQHIYEVFTAIFAYMDMLRRVGPQEQIFKEIQTIEQCDFRFQEPIEPVDNVEKLCEYMQLYNEEDILTGSSQLYNYSEKLISSCQEHLVPHKASLLIYSHHHSHKDCPNVEPWFKTPYSVNDIPEDWIENWKNIAPMEELHIPAENIYIASDFTLHPIDITSYEEPQLITKTDQIELWYKQDCKFKVPKVCIYFLLTNPMIYQSAESFVMFNLFVRALEENLAEVAYAANVAQLSYSIQCTYSGLEIILDGYNEKIHMLFETIVDHLSDFNLSEELFTTIKEKQRDCYHNHFIKPESLKSDIWLSILQQHFWSSVVKYKALENITCKQLLTFVDSFKQSLYVDALVHGNYTAEGAKQLESYFLTKMSYTPLSEDLKKPMQSLIVGEGDQSFSLHNMNVKDVNSAITNHYQFGPATLHQQTLNGLLLMHMEEPCFDILRTREQLGYSVYCTHTNMYNVIGFDVTVNSQANKYKMSDLNNHIEKFLDEFGEMVDTMKQEDFATLVQAMITLKRCDDNYMKEESDRHWRQIRKHHYIFNRLERQIEILEKLTLEEFQDWYKSLVPSGGKAKKISVQVVGNANVTVSEEASEEVDDAEDTRPCETRDTIEFIYDSDDKLTIEKYRLHNRFYQPVQMS